LSKIVKGKAKVGIGWGKYRFGCVPLVSLLAEIKKTEGYRYDLG